jgi:hypothetical protein
MIALFIERLNDGITVIDAEDREEISITCLI